MKYKGFKIKLEQDLDVENPNEEDRFLVYDHRDLFVQKEGFVPKEIFENWNRYRKTFQGYWNFAVEAYIHSGIVLAISGTKVADSFPDRRWDVSFRGFAMIKREKGTHTRTAALKAAKSLIKNWNTYLSGDVWWYYIPKLNESCGGFYGEDAAIEDAKKTIDYHLSYQNESRTQTTP